MTRLVHATDLHWYMRPPLRSVTGKRVFGSANLYLRGRVRHFSPEVQRLAVAKLAELEPDIAVITGDLTAQALHQEFARARQALDPLLHAAPTMVMNGNHDVYTAGSARNDRIAQYFPDTLHRIEGGISRLDHGPVTVIGLDPCRPHWSASGVVPAVQLDALAVLLTNSDLQSQHVVLALHYPILHPNGEVYDRPAHGLRNASALIDVLRAAPKRPVAILHGHRHHGYRIDLDLGDVAVPIFNPGSSGQAFDPRTERAACVNLYTIDDGRVDVTRYRHDGIDFVEEQGGAYSSGR